MFLRFKNIISKLEGVELPPLQFGLIFLSSVMLRNFLEYFAYHQFRLWEFYPQLHFSLYYLAIGLALSMVLSWSAGVSFAQGSKMLLLFFPIIILCPIVDIVATKFGIHSDLGYLQKNFSYSFFHFFAGLGDGPNPSLGYRVEVAIVLFFSAIYIYYKRSSLIRTLLGLLLMYSTIFFFLITAPILNWFFGPSSNTMVIPYFAHFSLLLALSFFAGISPKYFAAIFRDLRWLRLLHFELLFFVGIALASQMADNLSRMDWFYVGLIVWAIAFAWLFAVMQNNLADLTIDRVSNPKRPLFSSDINPNNYRKIATIVAVLALALAALVKISALFYLLMFMLSYSLYSTEPFRLKRIPVLSKLPIAFNSWLMLLMGYSVVGVEARHVPTEYTILILIGFTLAINFIDLKDYEGDKAAGIPTLPVLIGLPASRLIIALVFGGLHLFAAFLIQSQLFSTLLLVLGILQIIAILRLKKSDAVVIILWGIALTFFAIDRYSSSLDWANPNAVAAEFNLAVHHSDNAAAYFMISKPNRSFLKFEDFAQSLPKIMDNLDDITLPEPVPLLNPAIRANYQRYYSAKLGYFALKKEDGRWRIIWQSEEVKRVSSRMKRADYFAAESLLRKLLKVNPEDGKLLYLLSQCAKQNANDYSESWKKAIKTSPKKPDFANALAVHYGQLAEYDSSLHYFQIAKQNAQSRDDIRDFNYNAASLCLQMRKYKLAKEYISNSLSVAPNFKEGLMLQKMIFNREK